MIMNPVHHIRKNVLAMTQEQLASALGVTQASVSRWEALGTFPTEHQMQIRTLAGGFPGWSDTFFLRCRRPLPMPQIPQMPSPPLPPSQPRRKPFAPAASGAGASPRDRRG